VFCYGELQGYKMLRLGKCRAGSLRAQQSSMMVIRWAGVSRRNAKRLLLLGSGRVV
jgi:hypothetical protein